MAVTERNIGAAYVARREERGVFVKSPRLFLSAGTGGKKRRIDHVGVIPDAQDVFGGGQGAADGFGGEDFVGLLFAGAVGAAEGDGGQGALMLARRTGKFS